MWEKHHAWKYAKVTTVRGHFKTKIMWAFPHENPPTAGCFRGTRWWWTRKCHSHRKTKSPKKNTTLWGYSVGTWATFSRKRGHHSWEHGPSSAAFPPFIICAPKCDSIAPFCPLIMLESSLWAHIFMQRNSVETSFHFSDHNEKMIVSGDAPLGKKAPKKAHWRSLSLKSENYSHLEMH